MCIYDIEQFIFKNFFSDLNQMNYEKIWIDMKRPLKEQTGGGGRKEGKSIHCNLIDDKKIQNLYSEQTR